MTTQNAMDLSTEALVRRASEIHSAELAAYRDGGGKVVGYCCVATPREILDAAGVMPYRIRALGSTARELADAHMSRFNCSYCRSCLQLGLDGTYEFLDGLIETNGCDHLRGMFENWQHHRPVGFFHYIRVPHLKNPDTFEVYREELELLRQALRESFDAPITDDDLREAMERQRRIRRQLDRIQGLRDRDPPAILGTEVLALTLLESAWPPAAFEKLLDRVLDQRPKVELKRRARLLMTGSATDELGLLQAVENLGGIVVADGLCYGSRVFWRETQCGERDQDHKDPLWELADSYLDNLLCPRMFDDYDRRLRFVSDLARRAAADGVVLVHNKFCDLHGVENVRLRIDLEAQGIPALVLEKEYGAASDLGRVSTRVQAFIERLHR